MDTKKTKIVCTIGPSSWDPKILEKLAKAGMDVARLNFSHGSYQEKGKQIDDVRKISKKSGKSLAVMADMQGPKIRLGKIGDELLAAHAGKLPGGQQEGRNPIIMLLKGEKIELSSEPKGLELPMQFDLSGYLKKGDRILLNDGLVEAVTDKIEGKTIYATVQNDGYISSNKGVNVPDTLLPGASLTPKDYADSEFALKKGVDFLAISFVQSPDDLKKARELIKRYSPKTKLVVKLEKPQAVENLEEIVKATDVIMVARGDLAIETDAAKVPLVQKRIMKLARQNFKQVIVATQMLESMTENPRPTRAEVSDVANAVFDQADAVMLSGESANGKYPEETVKMMASIIKSVEAQDEYKNSIGIDMAEVEAKELETRAIAASSAVLAGLTEAKAIVAGTASGKTVQSISAFRPDAQIIAVTEDEIVKNQLVLCWGVTPYLASHKKDINDFWGYALKLVKDEDIAKAKDRVIIISGTNIGTPGNTDTIKLETV